MLWRNKWTISLWVLPAFCAALLPTLSVFAAPNSTNLLLPPPQVSSVRVSQKILARRVVLPRPRPTAGQLRRIYLPVPGSSSTQLRYFSLPSPRAFFSQRAGSLLPIPRQFSTYPIRPSFYVDVNVGIDVFSSPASNTTEGNLLAILRESLGQFGRMSNSDVAASLGIGYEFPVNTWFSLGGRVFVRYANNFDAINGRTRLPNFAVEDSNDTRVKLRDFEVGIDLTPSISIGANQFLTGIFGLAFNRARLDSTSVVETSLAFTDALTNETAMTRTVTGVRLGLSVEELLSRYFGLTMSYIWTGYGSIHIRQSNVDLGAFRSDSDINFETHNILLGLKYYFSPQYYRSTLHSMTRNFNRVYLSLAVGTLINQTVASGVMTSIEGAFNFTEDNKIKQGGPTLLGVFGLGVGLLIHRFYLGTELQVNTADRRSQSELIQADSFRNVNKTVRVNLNSVEGTLDLKLGGVIVPQTLFITRVGISLNYLRLVNFLEYYPGFIGAVPLIEINQTASHTVAGFRFGVGLERLFSENAALTLNYIYTYYGHIDASETILSPTPVQSSAEARVGTHAVTLGFNYYF